MNSKENESAQLFVEEVPKKGGKKLISEYLLLFGSMLLVLVAGIVIQPILDGFSNLWLTAWSPFMLITGILLFILFYALVLRWVAQKTLLIVKTIYKKITRRSPGVATVQDIIDNMNRNIRNKVKTP